MLLVLQVLGESFALEPQFAMALALRRSWMLLCENAECKESVEGGAKMGPPTFAIPMLRREKAT